MPVSLHTHSWYSLLEGVSSLESLLERAARCGYAQLALTDSNNLYGAVRFCELAPRWGIRPLVGACLRQGRQRCLALMAEPAGYRNLCRIISRLNLIPRESRLTDLLRQGNGGLHLLVDDPDLARELGEAFAGRLWLEVVRPRGTDPASRRRERELLEAGRRFGLPLVAGTAAHFATPEEYPVFRLATAIRRGELLEQVPARMTIGPEHHLPAMEEWRRRFADLPEAVANTDRLAEMLAGDVLPRQIVLPPARVPRSLDAREYLRLLCERGLRRRGLDRDPDAQRRLRHELDVIAAGGLDTYFLVVRDIARHARRKRYSMALRGSAGNSLACFLLEITDVNPLRFDLPLERFLHPGRPDLPDIDLDFDWKVRDQVIAEVFRRNGPEHTAMISSHLFLQPRSAFRESAKVHGLSNEQISRVQEEWPAADAGWVEAENPPDELGPIVHAARLLLGRPHHLSIHPGGVVITPGPIDQHVPLQLAAKGVVITQFEKDAVEAVGLVKIDLLGNRALGTVDEIQALEQESGVGGQESGSGPDDPATLELVRRGDTLGVNQLESPAMRHLLVQLRPRGVEDVILALALVRPGAASGGVKEHYLLRRHGREPFAIHPRLKRLLSHTCGFMIYEDDAPRMVQALTGWLVTETQRFYKQVTRSEGEAELRSLAETFLVACAAQGISREVAGEQFLQLTKFQHYAFCKSHAVSYGLIAWKACWWKAHRPLRFWTAVINNNQGMYPRRVYVEAIKRGGIALKLPCVNRSAGPFTAEGDVIRVGLEGIATLAEEFRARLLGDRARRGPYRDLGDLNRRLAPGPETLAVLIRAGALDFTGRSRPALFLEAELTPPREKAVSTLFPASISSENWTPADYSPARRRKDEWELLGFVTGPPFMSLLRSRLPGDLVRSCDLPGHVGRRVRVAGVTATYRGTTTIHGQPMQFITLEDEWGLIEVTLFPGTCPPLPNVKLGPYVVEGMVEENLGVITVNAFTVK